MSAPIRHIGIVRRVDDSTVYVVVERQSACAACHARQICGVDSGERVIGVKTAHASSFRQGDRVEVALRRRSMGIASILWGYVMPLFVLLLSLFAAKLAGAADGPAACVTLAAVIAYYIILYVLREYMGRKIQFTIIKQE